MPTIDELPPATASADTDEIPVTQNGISRKVTRAQFLGGVQPALAAATGSLIGRASAGAGAVEVLTVGPNLSLSGTTLSATAAPYVVSQLPPGTTPVASDLVPLSQSNVNTAVPFSQFAAGMSALHGVDASQFVVTPAGGSTGATLAASFANTLPKTGGQLQGPLLLATDPALARQAATKAYVDTRVMRAGDTVGGPLTWGSANNPNTSISSGTISAFQWGYASTTANIFTQCAGTVASTPAPAAFHCAFETTHSGGVPARVIQGAQFDCQVSNDYSGANGALVDGPATNHWALGATTYSDAVSAATAAGTAGSQHGGMYSQFVRTLPRGGYPSGKTGAEGWTLWLVTDDRTGQASSVGGALTGIEMDCSASGADDSASRYGIQFNLSADSTEGDGVCEWARFLYVNGYNEPGNQTWFQSILQLYAPYTVAAIDLSQGSQDIADPLTRAANNAVAVKLRSGQKYGLNGDGLTGQYLTHNAGAGRTELWSNGRPVLAVTDAGAIVAPAMPLSSAGLGSGALWSNGGVVTRVP